MHVWLPGCTRDAGLKTLLRRGAILGLVFALIGFLAAGVGLVPVAASSGHWALTDWFLHFTMRQSVQIRALRIEPPPDYAQAAQVHKGAGHYATSCAVCHGAPGSAAWGSMRHMTPPPPNLSPRIGAWEAEELFWIVRHGIKFTGMPAWPSARRDDEVWAMVGFLQQLPALSPEAYMALTTAPDAESPAARAIDEPLRGIIATCAICHRFDGSGGGGGAFPRLTGQTREYLTGSLDAFAEGRRHSGIMQAVAAGMDADQRRAVGAYYANLPVASTPRQSPSPQTERGRRIASRGLPEKGVPSCAHCHGPMDRRRNPFYPQLAGQFPDYLVLQLRLFKERRRGGTVYTDIMHEVVRRMTEEQMRDVAAYYAFLRP